MNPEYLKAVQHLHFWQYGHNPNNFTSELFTMFQKADHINKSKLARSFPVEFAAYMEWFTSPSQDEFFERYELPSFSMLYTQILEK